MKSTIHLCAIAVIWSTMLISTAALSADTTALPKTTNKAVSKSQTNALPKPVNQRHDNMFLLGPGYSFGFIYPKKVNDYIGAWLDNSNVETNQGFTAIVLSIVPRFNFNYAPIEYVQIQAFAEFGWAPKIMTVIGGESKFFNFLRMSLGGTINAHIPLKNYTRSLFLGLGAHYSSLRFEDYSDGTIGIRVQGGVRMYRRKRFTPEIILAFDYVKGKDNGLELNYNSVLIGANFLFDLTK